MATLDKKDIKRLQDDFDKLKEQFIETGDKLLRIAERTGGSEMSKRILDQFWEISDTMRNQARRITENVHPSHIRLGKQAYLIAHIDKETHKVEAIRVYSEKHPTNTTRQALATLIPIGGKNFQDACEKVIAAMMSGNPYFEWMEPFLEEWYESWRSRR